MCRKIFCLEKNKMSKTLEKEVVKLPFIDTIKQSFLYFFENLGLFVKLASLGIVVVLFDMFSDFPTLCAMRGIECPQSWQQSVSTLLLLLVSVSAIIMYCRNIIFKSTSMSWPSFVKALLLYALFSVFLVILIVIPSIAVMFLYGMIIPGAGTHNLIENVLLFVPLLIAIGVAPIFLIFPAIAVEDKSFGIRQVFALAKGNHNRIFWGQFLMMVPCAIVILILNSLYKIIGVDNYLINEFFIIVVIAFSLADSCLKASYYAHIYKFFKKNQE